MTVGVVVAIRDLLCYYPDSKTASLETSCHGDKPEAGEL